MTCHSLDLTLDDAMADPVIGTAMRADRVDPKAAEAMFRDVARHLRVTRPPLAPPLRHLCRTGRAALETLRPW